MTLESVGGIFAAFGAVGSLLFGGGLYKKHLDHSNEIAVTKYRVAVMEKQLEQTLKDVAELKNSSVEIHAKMNLFTEYIKKLDMIPRLDERLDAMKELVEGIKDTVADIASDRR